MMLDMKRTFDDVVVDSHFTTSRARLDHSSATRAACNATIDFTDTGH